MRFNAKDVDISGDHVILKKNQQSAQNAKVPIGISQRKMILLKKRESEKPPFGGNLIVDQWRPAT